MSTLGKIEKSGFLATSNSIYELERSIFGFGIEQVLFAQELAGIQPLGRSLLALSPTIYTLPTTTRQ